MIQPVETQPLEIVDFSGGFTDQYLGAKQNRFKTMDNLVILRYDAVGKPITRFGSEVFDTANSQIPDLTRINNITYFNSVPLLVSGTRLWNYTPSWTNLTGPTSNPIFPTATTANVTSVAKWNNHLLYANDCYAPISKVYADGSNNLQLRTAGLPKPASSPSLATAVHTGKNFVYRFVYYYTYTVGTVVFEDFSDYVQVAIANADVPSTTAISITAIPVLSNSTTYNWDTTNIKVKIYRTITDGNLYYYVGQVSNGTTTYSDTTSDANLQLSTELYTNGGAVQNAIPPTAKVVHVVGDVALYGNIKENGEILSNEVRQAIPGDIDSVPPDFSLQIQDDVVGISSYRNLPIICARSSTWRIDGQYDIFGNGGMIGTKISDTATCISSQSVVQTIDGVFWAGEDGFYWSDAYKVVRINDQWVKTYKTYVATDTQKLRVQGKYDRTNRRVVWAMQSPDATETDTCFVLHLEFGVSDESCFTRWTGGNGTSFHPTAIEFVDGDMYRGDRAGYLLIHRDELLNDIRIDTLVAASTWVNETIMYDLTSVAYDFGSTFLRKFTPRINVQLQNYSNLSLQLVSNNDDNKKVEDLKPIRFRGNVLWGDADLSWGDPTVVWAFDGLIAAWRRFPARSLRSSYKQIQLTNAFVAIVNSDTSGNATTNTTLKTVTLNSASAAWPADSVDYVIAFESDSYVKEFAIVQRNSDTQITCSDPFGQFPLGSLKWVIRGYPKNEVFAPINYVIHFAYLGKTQSHYLRSGTGEVGT